MHGLVSELYSSETLSTYAKRPKLAFVPLLLLFLPGTLVAGLLNLRTARQRNQLRLAIENLSCTNRLCTSKASM